MADIQYIKAQLGYPVSSVVRESKYISVSISADDFTRKTEQT